MPRQPPEEAPVHSPDEAYGAFAWAYDGALGKRFFGAARRLLAPLLAVTPREKTHLDLACGTGFAVELFASRGYTSTGIDASLPMLRVGRGRARRLAAGDFRSLPLRGTFARITCLYDSLNHLQTPEELGAVFHEVRRLMDRDSLFLFDMNDPRIYPVVWGAKEPFVESGEAFRLEIATQYSRAEKHARALVTGWAFLPDGTRIEIHERHEQRAWSRREVRALLREAGLQVLAVDDFDPFREDRVVKMVFRCRARG